MEALGPRPCLTPHMPMTYLLPDSQSPLGDWEEKPYSRAGPESPETRVCGQGCTASLPMPLGKSLDHSGLICRKKRERNELCLALSQEIKDLRVG